MSDARQLITILNPKRADDPLSLRKRKIVRVLTASFLVGTTTFNLWHVSKQVAPGQQQYSSYSESISRDHQGKLIRDVIAVNTVVFLTSGTSYSRPSDWNAASNSVECIGGGGAGGGPVTIGCCAFIGGVGGVGGTYAKSVNLNIGATATYAIGAANGDSYFNATSAANAATLGNTVACAAKGATTSTALNTGTVLRAGGAAGGSNTGVNGGGGGGGGAGGLNAAGVGGGTSSTGTGASGGRGDGTFGGTGGGAATAGNPGAEWTSNPGGTTAGSGGGGGGGSTGGSGAQGGLYGGGGGGASNVGVGGAGRQGIIVISYAPVSGGARSFGIIIG